MNIQEEIMIPKFKGEVFDTIRFVKDGEFEVAPGIIVQAKAGDIFEMPKSHNLVVDACSKLISALLKTQAGFQGIKYWEVGSGQSGWSDTAPPNPIASDVALNNPLFRKAIQASDIAFIDNLNNVTASVTNRLQVSVTFLTTEANGYLREFGLFGGDSTCTATLGSGIMINRKTHGVIYKTNAIELQRVLRLTF